MHFLLFMEKMAGFGAQTLFSAERIQQDLGAGFFFWLGFLQDLKKAIWILSQMISK